MRPLVALVVLSGCSAAPSDPAHPPLPPFPATFLWGTATAPYQIEGGLHGSDWYQWESTSHDVRMAHADDGDHSYDLFDADSAAGQAMHNNAMRLGIDFSRLFPTAASFPSSPDATAVAHYHQVFASLKAHGLQPMVTLYHWALPTWEQDLTALTDQSGWLDDTIPDKFGAFAGWAGKEYGGEVDLWVTLNEPVINLAAGYVDAMHPPDRSIGDTGGVDLLERAARNMVYAHARAYDALHAMDTVDADGDGQAAAVSTAFHLRVFQPKPADDPTIFAANQAASDQLHYLSNVALLEAFTKGNLDYNLDGKLDGPNDKTADPALANRLDWLGVNYYGLSQVIGLGKSSLGPITGLPFTTDLDTTNAKTEYGWDIYPDGFRTVLDEVQHYQLPLLITENGIADSTDAQRPRFLADHLYVLEKAIADGLDVRGYFHWSVIDNFEWAGGYCPRFGLFAVDYQDPARARTARPSADVYRGIIDARAVDPSLFQKYPSYPVAAMTCPGG
jgi:beta-glucosidase